MVADICDEDELNTGTRSEGSYFAVFWWFIKMGTAFASLVGGVLLLFTAFDEQQNVSVDALMGKVTAMKTSAEANEKTPNIPEMLGQAISMTEKLRSHFEERAQEYPAQQGHIAGLIERTDEIRSEAAALRDKITAAPLPSTAVGVELDALLRHMGELKQQAPKTLFRLRLVEIGLPLVMSMVSIALTLRYPLTESRCYEIKEALKRRHAELAAPSTT
jgi:GPH family glycoside/pentoside/hexuronide:cation symporter